MHHCFGEKPTSPRSANNMMDAVMTFQGVKKKLWLPTSDVMNIYE